MIFNRQNHKLEDWYSRLPEEVRLKLDRATTDDWNEIILSWITAEVKKPEITKVTDKDEPSGEKYDMPKMREIVDFVFDRERVSTADLADKFDLDEESAEQILANLGDLGFIVPAKS